MRHVCRAAIAVAALSAVLALGVARTGVDVAAAPDATTEVAGMVVVRDDPAVVTEVAGEVDAPSASATVASGALDEVRAAEAAVAVDGGDLPIIAAPSFDGWADLRVPEEQSLTESTADPSPAAEPASAPGPASEGDPASGSAEDTRPQQALAMISYPWQARLPGWTVTFAPARDGLRGLTFSGEARIEIYVRPDDSAWDLGRVLAHELGHAVDLTLNDSGARREWADARGISDATPWWPRSGLADFATGAGDFAECFATWQTGSASLSQVAGPCSADDLDLLASMV